MISPGHPSAIRPEGPPGPEEGLPTNRCMIVRRAIGKAKGVALVYALVIVGSAAPFLLWTAVYIIRADDPAVAAAKAFNLWTSFLGAFGILAAIVCGWRGLWWLAGQSLGDWRLRVARSVVIGAVFALPPLWIVLRDEVRYGRILAEIPGLFLGFMLLIGWIGYRVTRQLGNGRVRDYLAAFAIIVVLMWLASEGVFRNFDDEGYYSDREEEPDPQAKRERLLRNIIGYSGAALVGVAIAHRRMRRENVRRTALLEEIRRFLDRYRH